MLKTKNYYLEGYFLLTFVLLLISSVNAQVFVKILNEEAIKNLRLQDTDDTSQLDSYNTNDDAVINSLRSNTRKLSDDVTNDEDNNDMQEEIIAEDEDGNMFLLVPKDFVESKELTEDDSIWETKDDTDNNAENNSNENNNNEYKDEIFPNTETEVTGTNNDDDDDETKLTSDDYDEEEVEDSDNVGRGHKHQKKKKSKHTSYHVMKKPFRKFKRIIRRGIKHPKKTFKKVLKAIILPKSAAGIIASSMFSNAVGFGSGSFAGMTAGSIAGGIASGIFRNFGSVGRNSEEKSGNSKETRSLKDYSNNLDVKKVPIAYLLAK